MQTVGIELVGVEVGGGHDADAVREHGFQQPVQDHRVGDVGNVKLVEADQPEASGNATTEFVQGVDRAFQILELPVNLPHELVKVQAGLAGQRHGLEEAVHEKTLSTPDTAMHVDTPRDLGAPQPLGQRVGPSGLVVGPLPFTSLQGVDRAQLGRVTLETALSQ